MTQTDPDTRGTNAGQGHGHHAPIFIGGQRRSGTTLMRTMLNRHPHIAVVPRESFFLQDERFERFFEELRQWHAPRFESLGIGQTEMDRGVAALIDTLFAPFVQSKGATRWADKTTDNILRIDYLFRLFPTAQFIHMIRDPRDTLCSMKQQATTYKPRWTKFTAAVTAPEWVRCIEAGLPWRQQPERYLEVRYEQFAHNPEVGMRQVLTFLDEPWHPEVLEPPTNTDLIGLPDSPHHTPVFTSSIARWKKDLSPEEIATIESIAGATMTSLGYEVGGY